MLTPSYKAMNLYGSEYWTYFLPSRVGHEVAHHLTESGNSILAEEAKRLGLVDKTFGRSVTIHKTGLIMGYMVSRKEKKESV